MVPIGGYTTYGRVNVTHSFKATKHNLKDFAVVECHVKTVKPTNSKGEIIEESADVSTVESCLTND